jgi:YVTN family beta-propeller protein
VLDAGSATVIGTIPVQAQPRMVAFDPSGTRAYVTNRKSGTVSVIDTASSAVIATITVGTTPYDIDVDPSGARVYNTNTGDGTVSVIDTNALRVIATVPVLNEPRCLAVHPDGRSLWVVDRGSYSVSIIDTSTLRVVTTTPVGPLPIGIAFTPDGARAYVTISGLMTKAGEQSGAVAVLDATTHQVTNKIIAGISPRTYGKFIGPATIVEPTPIASPSPSGLCSALPQLDCRLPTGTQRATLRMTESTRSDRDRVLWKWIGGEATPTQAFGDPAASDGYALCLYGEASGVPKLLLTARVPAGALCGAHPCWKASRSGFRYSDSARVVDGLSSITLQAGKEGAARVLVSGAGSQLKLPLLPLATPVRIQLQNTIGNCWETLFLASDVAVHGSGSNGVVWQQSFRNFETPD